MKRILYIFSLYLFCTFVFANEQSNSAEHQELATISDSFSSVNKVSTIFFFVAQIDGEKVENSYAKSHFATFGNGSRIITVPVSRDVESKPQLFKLVARSYHATVVNTVLKENLFFEATVLFTPTPGKSYIVRGELSEQNSELWIEEYGGKVVVSSKGVESNESADESEVNTSDFDKFRYVKIGDSLSDVVQLLGEPDSIKKEKANFLFDKPAMQYYTYDTHGTIRFSELHGQFQVSEIKSLKRFLGESISNSSRGVSNVSEADVITKLRENLDSKTGEPLKLYAEEILGQRPKEHELLDVLAEKIWKERNTTDDFSAATAAILCKAIMKAGDARYRSFLISLTEESQSIVVKKFAAKALKKIPEDNSVAQFKI